jgi:outer membrane immunogenic protein
MTGRRDTVKRLLLGTTGLVAVSLAAPASAADLPARAYTKAPAMIAALYDWSGFYLGINGGGGSSHNCWSLTNNAGAVVAPAAAEGCHDATGGTVGGQVGYRWQTGAWVFGVEGQGNWANLKGSNTNLFNPALTDQSKVNAFGLLTGQLGYSWNNVLLYAKGGAAVTGDTYTTLTIPGGAVNDRVGDTRWGGTVGAGLEYSFSPNWSLGAEYNHMFMGTKDLTAVTPGGTFSATDRVRQDVDMATARINYRWGGPVISKY